MRRRSSAVMGSLRRIKLRRRSEEREVKEQRALDFAIAMEEEPEEVKRNIAGAVAVTLRTGTYATSSSATCNTHRTTEYK
ncbi:hypothetical protein PIB30_053618 [Stylosanthes scabra]|uniref:Uncharacterized protein n=1 Tax=Stylosanthes scabra TaxID=79078 RepID=A0ABU6SID0_9FABA|nr:hypothetical protein [Stylosanthes scabra]